MFLDRFPPDSDIYYVELCKLSSFQFLMLIKFILSLDLTIMSLDSSFVMNGAWLYLRTFFFKEACFSTTSSNKDLSLLQAISLFGKSNK